MEENNGQNEQQSSEHSSNDNAPQGEKQEVHEVGAAITRDALSEEDLAELERKHGAGSRQGNSSI